MLSVILILAIMILYYFYAAYFGWIFCESYQKKEGGEIYEGKGLHSPIRS